MRPSLVGIARATVTKIGLALAGRPRREPSRAVLRFGSDLSVEAAAALLASLGAVAPGEVVLLQIAFRPGRPRTVPVPPSGSTGPTLFELATGAAVSKQHAAELRRKYGGPLLRTRLLVAVSCGHRK